MANNNVQKWVRVNETQFALVHGATRSFSCSFSIVEKYNLFAREHFLDGSILTFEKQYFYNREGELIQIHYLVRHQAKNNRLYNYAFPTFQQANAKYIDLAYKKYSKGNICPHGSNDVQLSVVHESWIKYKTCGNASANVYLIKSEWE